MQKLTLSSQATEYKDKEESLVLVMFAEPFVLHLVD